MGGSVDRWRGVMIIGVGEARIGDVVGTHGDGVVYQGGS